MMTRILIVDDERDVADFLCDAMEFAGWQTGSANNGVEAVLKVLEGGWDGVVMDIRMPKLDGVNALRIIKRASPELPVLMLTGQAGQHDISESGRLGAFTCLMKPISTDKLIEAVQQALAHPTNVYAPASGSFA